MARGLWPEDDPSQAVGRTVYIGADEPMTVIGIVATLQSPWPPTSNVEDSMLVPDKIVSNSVRYLVRTEPGRRDELMPVVEEALAQSNRQRIVRAPQSMAETRAFGYWLDSGISTTLAVVMAALLLITSFGIVGLASFSVRQRTRQIGTRRALGATKADILRYFLVENFLIASGGVLLGAVLTVAFNILLVQLLQVARVDWWAIPTGMAALWLLGLLAVLGPARKASAVPRRWRQGRCRPRRRDRHWCANAPRRCKPFPAGVENRSSASMMRPNRAIGLAPAAGAIVALLGR